MADLRAGLGHGVPDWLRVARWIPYEDVLPHVDAFVTNGGYTGVTLALAHGVPLVQVGSSEEKAEIGARIAWSKVGVRLALAPHAMAAAARGPAGSGRSRHPGRGGRDAGVLRARTTRPARRRTPWRSWPARRAPLT